MITVTHTGSYSNIDKFLKFISQEKYLRSIYKYAKKGVEALSNATPVDSGKTASSWNSEVIIGANSINIYWNNDNINKGVNIAVILQYGHGTRNGGYVQGRDYINPAIRPVFDKMAEELWKEVTSA